MDGVYFHDFEIYVDIWGQLKLNQFFDSTFGKLSKFPSFPLNTDGIDPSGKNILIERVKITNFDDAIAVKPMDSRGKIAKCTENVVARDIEVVYGVGMTIGTVPARSYYTCVKNVTFQNVTFHRPLKAIYIKQNP
jgi:polygalacturonase